MGRLEWRPLMKSEQSPRGNFYASLLSEGNSGNVISWVDIINGNGTLRMKTSNEVRAEVLVGTFMRPFYQKVTLAMSFLGLMVDSHLRSVFKEEGCVFLHILRRSSEGSLIHGGIGKTSATGESLIEILFYPMHYHLLLLYSQLFHSIMPTDIRKLQRNLAPV